MEPKFNTSFIPKKPVATVSKSVGGGSSGIGLFTLIATVIFLAAVLFAIGVFMYRITLEQRIATQINTLERVRESFEPNFISQASRLNKRIISTRRILDRHLAPSSVFALLEDFTLQTVSFSAFSFKDTPEGTIMIEGRGEGDSFRSIVLQSDEFGGTDVLRNVLFDGLEPNVRGNVDFTFEATVDPQLVLYRKLVNPAGVPDVEQLEDEGQEDLGVFGNPNNN